MNIFDKTKAGVQMLIGFLVAFFTAVFAHTKKDGPKLPPGDPPPTPTLPPAPNTTHYATESWRPFVDALILPGIPSQFVMNFIRKESDGNPCAVGNLNAKGPDGYPLEQGIGQFYNPDDMKLLGVPSGAFRKYCQPGSQTCTRPLTQSEMAAQVRATIAKIKSTTGIASRILVANGAGALRGWSPTLEDFWRLVKLIHGLPGLANGMAFVTKKLGHAPNDWSEFKDQILNKGVKLDSGTERYRARFAAIFGNAEDTADGVGTATS